MKPAAIKKFDLLYLGSVAVSLLGVLMVFDTMVEISNDELAAQGIAPMGQGFLIAGLAFWIFISLALWFLVSKLRIEFVKYVLALFAAYGVYTAAMGSGGEAPVVTVIISWISTMMTVGAVYFLFTPEAKAWFAQKRGSGD